MNLLKKIKSLILPKEINYFESLKKQGEETAEVINELSDFYLHNPSEDPQKIFELISEAKKCRHKNLKELSNALITPVDKEAISRAYIHLHWVVLSVKHLVVEMGTYNIYSLKEYHKIIELLQAEIIDLTDGFALLNKKEYDHILKKVYQVIHSDNLLIKEYAKILAVLFQGNDFKKIFQHREVLSQLKEISKRIHICANQLEDIVFKMN